MLRTGLSRRLIALVAAYGLALQAMLAAVVVAAPGTAFASVICAPDHRSNAGGGTRHDPAPGPECDCAFCPLAGAGPVALPTELPSPIRVYGNAAPMRAWRGTAPVGLAAPRAGLARAPPT